MENKQLNEIKRMLEKMAEHGKEQLDQYRSKNDSNVKINGDWMFSGAIWKPSHTAMMDLMTNPDHFLYQTVDQYWVLYKRILSSIEDPLVQFSLRTLMEMTYTRIIAFSELEQEQKETVAIKFWLFTLALLIPSDETKNRGRFRVDHYNYLITKLDTLERVTFEKYRDEGFPFKTIQKELHNLLPSVPNLTNDHIQTLTELMGEDSHAKELLDRQYRHLSMVPHGNPVVIRLLGDNNDKNHLLRTAKILQVTSSVVIRYLYHKLRWIVDIDKFEEIQEESQKTLLKYWQNRSNN